jgi:hypothetical protein
MLHTALWGPKVGDWTLDQAKRRLVDNPSVIRDLQSVLEHRFKNSLQSKISVSPQFEPLSIHASYTRDEILVALGHWSFQNRPIQQTGVLHLKDRKLDVFFVTLQKSEDEYSPTTMYEDYMISHDLFHWQTMSKTSEQSSTGQRYIRHGEMGYTPLLFVRETKVLPSGLSAPYHFLGPCQYVSHTGSRPISITWRLKHPVPAGLYRSMARQIAV